jgi:hypothetical protein
MNDAAVAVSPLAGKVVAGAGSVARKRHSLADKPVDRRFSTFHDKAGRAEVTEAGTGNQSVLDVRLDRVGIIQGGSDAPLGAAAGTILKRSFGDQGDFFVRGQLQSQGLAGQTAADNQNVENLHVEDEVIEGPKLYHWAAGPGKAPSR